MSNELKNKAEKVGKQGVSHPATRDAPASHEATPSEPSSGDRTTAASRQTRDEPRAVPSADDVKDRLRAQRGRGPDRPLARLAYVEAELEKRSAALTKLSEPPRNRADKNLLVHQLLRTVDTSGVPKTLVPQVRKETIGLYSSLGSEDPTESIFNRIIVAQTNTVMACHARANAAINPQAIDINLRHAVKGTKAIIELVEALERRRGPRQVVVGKVNVEAGGKAIFGNVETRPRQSDDEEPDKA